jgi:hypothetical protein
MPTIQNCVRHIARDAKSGKQREQQSDRLRCRPAAVFQVIILGLLCAQWNLAIGQKPSGDARSRGNCSPAVTGENNTFYFQYCGFDPQEGKRMERILQAIQSGEELSNEKLDKILAIVGEPVSYGNIYQRAIELAKNIDWHERTCLEGSHLPRSQRPFRMCSLSFRSRDLPQVIDLRNELAHFHYEDDILNEDIDAVRSILGGTLEDNPQNWETNIPPLIAQEVGERVRVLAYQLPGAPKEERRSVSGVSAH